MYIVRRVEIIKFESDFSSGNYLLIDNVKISMFQLRGKSFEVINSGRLLARATLAMSRKLFITRNLSTVESPSRSSRVDGKLGSSVRVFPVFLKSLQP